jgi:hypothetical protein
VFSPRGERRSNPAAAAGQLEHQLAGLIGRRARHAASRPRARACSGGRLQWGQPGKVPAGPIEMISPKAA